MSGGEIEGAKVVNFTFTFMQFFAAVIGAVVTLSTAGLISLIFVVRPIAAAEARTVYQEMYNTQQQLLEAKLDVLRVHAEYQKSTLDRMTESISTLNERLDRELGNGHVAVH